MYNLDRSNKHHLIYPRRNYKEPYESRFRLQPYFIEEIPVPVHEMLHLRTKPPIVVPAHVMFEVIEMQASNIDVVIDNLDFSKDAKARRLADHLMNQLDIMQTPVDEAIDYLRSRGWNR